MWHPRRGRLGRLRGGLVGRLIPFWRLRRYLDLGRVDFSRVGLDGDGLSGDGLSFDVRLVDRRLGLVRGDDGWGRL